MTTANYDALLNALRVQFAAETKTLTTAEELRRLHPEGAISKSATRKSGQPRVFGAMTLSQQSWGGGYSLAANDGRWAWAA